MINKTIVVAAVSFLLLSTHFLNVRAQVVKQVAADYEKKYEISGAHYSEVSDFIEHLAKEYSFEVVKPMGDIVLSDGVKFIIALRSKESSGVKSKLYCMTIDNVKNVNYLYLKGYSGECNDKSSYDEFLRKLSSKLLNLESF